MFSFVALSLHELTKTNKRVFLNFLSTSGGAFKFDVNRSNRFSFEKLYRGVSVELLAPSEKQI